MADKAVDPDDPMTLTGNVILLSATEARQAAEDMAGCVVEEFARMGWTRRRIRNLFTDPHYRATHGFMATRGAVAVDELLDRVGVRSDKEA